MARQLPPMLSVRVFEAAARHGSFAKAASELFVSAGAVAHQVRQLEDWLGLPLFLRTPRSVELTDAGQAYLRGIAPLLEELERVSMRWRQHAEGASEVTVSAMPSFVTRWLMPRLGAFRAAHPAVEVRVLAAVAPVDFARDRVDVAIRLGSGPYPGMEAQPLLHEAFYPVASPRWLERHGMPMSPRDLLGSVLLHDEFEPRIPEQISWEAWFAAQGVAPGASLRPAPALRFSHSYLALDAAAAGQGVALASDVLARDALQRGELARAWPDDLPGPYRYHLLCQRGAGDRPAVVAFTHWLRAAADAFAAQP